MTSPQITEVRRLYAEAEDAIKLYERIGLDNLASAVNELRYAGEHVLVADTSDDEETKAFALIKASRHCERARYDALEATIVTLLDSLANYRQSDLTSDEMTAFFPMWKECLAKATTAQRIVESAGAVKNANADELKSAIDELLRFRCGLLEAEPKIVAQRNQRTALREEEKRRYEESVAEEKARAERSEKTAQSRQFLLSFSATVAGSVVGLVGTIIAVCGEFPAHRLLGVATGIIGFGILCVATYLLSAKHLLTKETIALIKQDARREK